MSCQPNESADQILVLDTDQMICDLMKYNLANEGYTITLCNNADAALDRDLTVYSLIIADTGAIGPLTGLRFTRMIKENPDTMGVPVILCSSADSEDDIVAGFNAGADDYILKPFSLREMIARVKAVIRRHNLMNRRAAAAATAPVTLFRHDGLMVDLSSQNVTVDNEPVSLSRTEFQLLSVFVKQPGRLFSRGELFDIIRPGQDKGSDRTIDVNISRLRKKLGNYGSLVVNKSGQGYGLIINKEEQ